MNIACGSVDSNDRLLFQPFSTFGCERHPRLASNTAILVHFSTSRFGFDYALSSPGNAEQNMLFLVLVLCIAVVQGHSWIDCLDTDRTVVYNRGPEYIYGGNSANGMCAGYMKNYVGRGDPDVNTKMTFKILIADVANNALICTTDAWDYSDWRHRLALASGTTVYFGYTSNGHIVKEQAAGKTFYGVYWTGVPDTSLATTFDLTSDKLIDGQLHNFDDGNCGEVFTDEAKTISSGRAGDGYPCVATFTVPAGTAPGVYNLVWYWKFYDAATNTSIPTSSGIYGGAAYTSCFQVEVTA